MVDIRLDFFHFPAHAIVHLFDQDLFLLGLPFEGIFLMFMMQVIDASIGLDIMVNFIRLAIIDFLNLSQMLHIHLISHLIIHDI